MTRRRWLAAGISVIVIAALIALAATKLDLKGVGHALARVKPGWVVVALALMGSSFVARAESWYAVIRVACPEAPVRRRDVLRGMLIGMAGSAVAPGRLGEAARAWLVARRLGHPGRTVSVVVGTLVSQTLLNVLALVLLTLVALSGGALTTARVSALAVVVALPAGLLALLYFGPKLLRRLSSRPGRLGRLSDWVLRQVLSVRSGLRMFRRPGPAIHATGVQLLAWGLQLGTCYVTLVAFGLTRHAGLPAAAAVLVAVNVTAILPVTPSNVGVFQAACIAVLAPFGVGASQGLAYGLILQAVEIVAAVGLGVPALLHEGLSVSELRREALEAEAHSDESGDTDTPHGTGAAAE
jgi:phosphatidylinositol alpha-mannosyltransferase